MADEANAAIQALQDQIDALQNQLNQQPAAVQQPPAVPPAAQGPFALTPALAAQNVIDYSTTNGGKIYKAAITGLKPPFDGTPANLPLFLDDVDSHAANFGWDNILIISDQDPTNPTNRNLITQHRMLTIANVTHAAQAYLGNQSREAQNSHQMLEFLKNSLSENARKKMMTENDKFTVTVNGVAHQDGPLFLKTILNKCYVETNATNFYLRQTLLNLPAKMEQLSGKIDDFNEYVKNQIIHLAAGGAESSDLLVYLFMSYLKVKDRDFIDYIKRKKESYDEGHDTTPTALMDAAEIKYLQLTQAQTWCAPSEEEKQIVALAAQLKEAKSTLAKMKGKTQPKNDSKRDPSASKGSSTSTDQSWMKQKPRPGQKTRTYKGKSYKWCEHHAKWTSHFTDECRAKKKAVEGKKSDHKAEKSEDKSLTIAKALVAITDDDDSSLHDE